MRLIDTRTIRLSEHEFFHDIPPYAILSHTWGAEEVSLQDLQSLPQQIDTSSPHPISLREGYRKIEECCKRALHDGLNWAWVDTCCIDKTSSAELSEAINSMFQWYEDSTVCYAYLADVPSEDVLLNLDTQNSAFRKARWFTRGWTLQELLAPSVLLFFDGSWKLIGDMEDRRILQAVSETAGIPSFYLASKDISRASVAQRMSWMANRSTTRTEDIAYSLLGIFGINMPLLYGEGDKAFQRLQLEILQQINDQTIFAWGLQPPDMAAHFGLDRYLTDPDKFEDIGLQEPFALAISASDFAGCGNLIASLVSELESFREPIEVTRKGIRVMLGIIKIPNSNKGERTWGILDCQYSSGVSNYLVAIPLGCGCHLDPGLKLEKGKAIATRYREFRPLLLDRKEWDKLARKGWWATYIQNPAAGSSSQAHRCIQELAPTSALIKYPRGLLLRDFWTQSTLVVPISEGCLIVDNLGDDEGRPVLLHQAFLQLEDANQLPGAFGLVVRVDFKRDPENEFRLFAERIATRRKNYGAVRCLMARWAPGQPPQPGQLDALRALQWHRTLLVNGIWICSNVHYIETTENTPSVPIATIRVKSKQRASFLQSLLQNIDYRAIKRELWGDGKVPIRQMSGPSSPIPMILFWLFGALALFLSAYQQQRNRPWSGIQLTVLGVAFLACSVMQMREPQLKPWNSYFILILVLHLLGFAITIWQDGTLIEILKAVGLVN